jgi:hypothetical protein
VTRASKRSKYAQTADFWNAMATPLHRIIRW